MKELLSILTHLYRCCKYQSNVKFIKLIKSYIKSYDIQFLIIIKFSKKQYTFFLIPNYYFNL